MNNSSNCWFMEHQRSILRRLYELQRPDSVSTFTNDMIGHVSDLIEVPESFTERFLWTHCQVASSDTLQGSPTDLGGPLAPYQFSDQTVKHFQAILSWNGSQPAIAIPPESELVRVPRAVTLLCPFAEANDIIDSLVKLVAAREQADVLVLDALELAAGLFGALGKSARVIDEIYKAPSGSEGLNSDKSQDSNIDDQSVQRFFDMLMTAESKSIAGDKGAGHDPNDSRPRRRIIYLRDFGSVARAAKPLVIFILQAIDNCSREGNPRALVMGVTAAKESSIVSDEELGRALSSPLYDQPSLNPFLILEMIPSVKHECPVLTDYASSTLLNPLAANFFLPLSAGPSKLEYKTLTINRTCGGMMDHFIISESILVACPTNSHGEGFRNELQNATRARRRDINDMLLRIHLGTRAGSMCDSPSREIFAESVQESSDDRFLPSILHWSTATSVSTTAIGLAWIESPGALAPITVSSGNVAKAYQLFIQNERTRAERVNEGEAQQGQNGQAENAGEEDEEEDERQDEEEDEEEDERQDEEEDERKDERKDEEISTIESISESRDQSASNKDEDARQDQHSDNEDPIVKRVKESRLSGAEKQYLGCIVNSSSLLTRFDDVCVDPAIIDNIRTVISLPMLYPAYFEAGLLSREYITGVLLYGPPGTGKTMLCRALAKECGARMLFVKPSDVLECLVGDSEKKIVGLFSLAGRLAPCVMFIDEVDALFSARGEDTKSHRRDMLVECMQAMDGLLSGGKKGVIVVGATNRPFDLDEAILRRLPCRMLVDLPPEPQRLKILKFLLKDETVDIDLRQVAHDTEEYSGSDLKSLCVAATLAAVRSAIGDIDWKAGTQHASGGETPGPCPKNCEGAANTGSRAIIRRVHFDQARSTVFPAFSEKASSRLYRWHEKFATGASTQCMLPPTKVGSNATSTPTKGHEDADIERFMTTLLSKEA